MSDVKTIRADLIAKIAAAVGAGITIGKWAGEEKAMNPAKPGVFVAWAGAIASESMEIGAATYQYEFVFHVVVQTKDSEGEDGDDAAAALLDKVRAALNEVEIGGLGVARPYRESDWGGRTETLMQVHAGVYEYAQAWRIELLKE